jgi:hypothetical protein
VVWAIVVWVANSGCQLDHWDVGWTTGLWVGQLGCGMDKCAVGWTTGQSQLKLGKFLSSISKSRESLNPIRLTL